MDTESSILLNLQREATHAHCKTTSCDSILSSGCQVEVYFLKVFERSKLFHIDTPRNDRLKNSRAH